MTTTQNAAIEQKLDRIIGLLQHVLAIELAKTGATQEAIGKNLHIAKATVVKMLQGIKNEK